MTEFRTIRDVEGFYIRKEEKKEWEYKERVKTEEIYENIFEITNYRKINFSSLNESCGVECERVLGRIFCPFAFMKIGGKYMFEEFREVLIMLKPY